MTYCSLCAEEHDADLQTVAPPGIEVCPQCAADVEIYLGGSGIPGGDWVARLEEITGRSYNAVRRSWLSFIIGELERRGHDGDRQREVQFYEQQLVRLSGQ
jgi:hypothetical protein